MNEENTKLNHKLIINVNLWAHDEMKKVAQNLGVSVGLLARTMIHSALKQIHSEGMENIGLSLEPIPKLKPKKKK